MTNYNQRLDEILHDLYLAGWNDKLLDDSPTAVPSEKQKKRKTKQAITSLTKELMAEAKPPHVHGTTVSSGQFNRGVSEFEQNLLKALKEV